jgi:hypothetical protein
MWNWGKHGHERKTKLRHGNLQVYASAKTVESSPLACVPKVGTYSERSAKNERKDCKPLLLWKSSVIYEQKMTNIATARHSSGDCPSRSWGGFLKVRDCVTKFPYKVIT